MKRAAIYLRVSTSAQAKRNREPEGYSIPAQREACLRKAASLDAEVVGEYVDRGESAKTADRAELRALLERVKQQRDLDYVIVHKVDRLARNRYDDATISYTLKAAGIELVSVTENIDDTPFGRFMHAIVAANAEFYSANLAAEARKGLVQKAKTGGTPTRAPIGYLNVRKMIEGREIRTVEIDPDRAPHIRWAITAYATGAYTLDTLGDVLTDRGLLTRPTPTRPAKPLSRSQLATLLVNPYYIGIVRYAGVEYDGNHEPLIDKTTFQRARSVLEAHGHAEERDRKHDHYLKGTLYCGRCDSRMSLTHAKGNGGTYPYFFCIGRTRRNGCQQPYIPTDTIERAVERLYAHVTPSAKHIDTIRSKLDHALAGMRKQAERETARQQRRLAKLTDERTKLLHAYYQGAIPLDLLHQEQERIVHQITSAEAQLAIAQRSTTDVQSTLDKALDLLANCQHAYTNAPAHLRRQWNQALFLRLHVHDQDIQHAEIAEPFATLTNPTLATALDHHEQQPHKTRTRGGQNSAVAFNGGGSNKPQIVGANGFEPVPEPDLSRYQAYPLGSDHLRSPEIRSNWNFERNLEPPLACRRGHLNGLEEASAPISARCHIVTPCGAVSWHYSVLCYGTNEQPLHLRGPSRTTRGARRPGRRAGTAARSHRRDSQQPPRGTTPLRQDIAAQGRAGSSRQRRLRADLRELPWRADGSRRR
jgi:site-specific DNA recombinase